MGCGCGGSTLKAPPDVPVVRSERVETVANHPDNVYRPPNAPPPKTEG